MSNIERIVFYNPCNRGDLHISREIVKHTMSMARSYGVEKFAYVHRWDADILADIDGLEHWTPEKLPFDQCNVVRKFLEESKTWALNTWYASSPVWGINGGGYGMTLNTLAALFKAHHEAMGMSWGAPAIEKLIPQMEWGKFQITSARAIFETDRVKQATKRVLFANGGTMSGQAKLDDTATSKLLERLVFEHQNVFFFYTSQNDATKSVLLAKNALPTDAVIGKKGCDLNENAFIGSKCDVIIGRASGPYSFCLNTDVLLDTKKTMIALCDDERCAQWVYMSGVPLCPIWHLPHTNEAFLFAKISEALR